MIDWASRARKRVAIDTLDWLAGMLAVWSFVAILLAIADESLYRGIIWFLIFGASVLIHSYCTALLNYRQALQGRTVFGGKIADAIHIMRRYRKQRLVRADQS